MINSSLDPFLNPVNAPVGRMPDPSLQINFDQNINYPLGRMNYSNLSRASRAYTAVLAPNREQGAFTDLQAAINYCHSLKGGNILVLPGTYTYMNTEITMYDSIYIIGLDANSCIISFNFTPGYFNLDKTYISKISNLTICNSTAGTTGVLKYSESFFNEVSFCEFINNTGGTSPGNVSCINAGSSGKFKVSNNFISNCDSFYNISAPFDINEVNSNYAYLVAKSVFMSSDSVNNGGGQTNYHSNFVYSDCGTAFYGYYSFAQITGNNLNKGIYFTGAFGNQIHANNIIENASGKNAISFTSSSSENETTGNFLSGGTAGSTYAISFDATSNTNIAIGNRLRGNAGTIQDLGSGNVISPNV